MSVGNIQSDLKMLYNNTQCEAEIISNLFTSDYDPFTNLRSIGWLVWQRLGIPRENVLVIDAGTCITYDFITAKAHHIGGVIGQV